MMRCGAAHTRMADEKFLGGAVHPEDEIFKEHACERCKYALAKREIRREREARKEERRNREYFESLHAPARPVRRAFFIGLAVVCGLALMVGSIVVFVLVKDENVRMAVGMVLLFTGLGIAAVGAIDTCEAHPHDRTALPWCCRYVGDSHDNYVDVEAVARSGYTTTL